MTEPSSHLTLEQLTAHAAGAPLDAAAQAHLAGCATCQADLRGWSATAGGVRLLTSAATPPPGVIDKVLTSVDRTAGTAADALLPAAAPPRERPLAGRWRAALAAAAAAVVLLGAVGLGWGLRGTQEAAGTLPPETAGGPPPRDGGSTTPAAAGVASTDCDEVKVTAGTLERTDGSTLELRTPGGESVPVHASGSSEVTRLAAAAPSADDIIDGALVVVHGQGSATGESLDAEQVTLLPGGIDLSFVPLPELPWLNLSQLLASQGTAIGTVSDASGDGFTVTGLDDNEVQVHMSSSTSVIKPVRASLSEMEQGRFTAAVGTLAADGSLEATTIQQDALANGDMIALPDVPGLPDDLLLGSDDLSDGLFSGLGCDPDTIATRALLAAGA